MKRKGFRPWASRTVLLTAAWLLCFASGAAPYVDITAEVEIKDWHYFHSVGDYTNRPGPIKNEGLFRPVGTVHCVVGTNRWMIEIDDAHALQTWWFTGTNILEQVVLKSTAKGDEQNHPGDRFAWIHETKDGNPFRPGGQGDLMFGSGEKMTWLAFCSGSYLKQADRKLYPLSDFWKESAVHRGDWSSSASTFQDGLGLPVRIDLQTTNSQRVFLYQVHEVTNVLDWTFPREFSAVQYWLNGRTCELYLTIRGKLKTIHEGTEPEVPAEAWKAVRKQD